MDNVWNAPGRLWTDLLGNVHRGVHNTPGAHRNTRHDLRERLSPGCGQKKVGM